jgi:hypothetical protein
VLRRCVTLYGGPNFRCCFRAFAPHGCYHLRIRSLREVSILDLRSSPWSFSCRHVLETLWWMPNGTSCGVRVPCLPDDVY